MRTAPITTAEAAVLIDPPQFTGETAAMIGNTMRWEIDAEDEALGLARADGRMAS